MKEQIIIPESDMNIIPITIVVQYHTKKVFDDVGCLLNMPRRHHVQKVFVMRP